MTVEERLKGITQPAIRRLARRGGPVSGNFVPNLVMIVMNDFPYLAKVTMSGKFGRYGRRSFPATV